MRKFLIAACVGLSLAGCSATVPNGGTGTAPSPLPAQVTNVIETAQAVATQVCGFVPTVSTITNILSLGNPALSTATAVAQAICSAVSKRSASRSSPRPNVQGIIVEGRFVR